MTAATAGRIQNQIDTTQTKFTDLERRQSLRQTWHQLHPEHAHRVRYLRQAIADLDHGRLLPAAERVIEPEPSHVDTDAAHPELVGLELPSDARSRASTSGTSPSHPISTTLRPRHVVASRTR